MCKVKVSYIDILFFFSTKYIPSANFTFCDVVALSAAAKRKKKKKEQQSQKEPPDHLVP